MIDVEKELISLTEYLFTNCGRLVEDGIYFIRNSEPFKEAENKND